jgi:hypothetical protein
MVLEKWVSSCRQLKWIPFTLCQYQFKVDQKLNIRPETLKQLQERVGNTLELTVKGNNFLKGTPMVQQLRERMSKWDCINYIHCT